MTIRDQINNAKESLSKTAKSTPYIFPEYHAYIDAERELFYAQIKYKKCKENWESILGEKVKC
jgi:hypothetical protein